ncbi:MAG: hypothetical protein H5U39_04675 [Deferribacterales bacterium]|nr:hypothetical protein [Deferribacterales bacterium]
MKRAMIGRQRRKNRVVKKMGIDKKILGIGRDHLAPLYNLGEASVEYIA